MKKYEKYKEVDLPWLKEIPEGWEVGKNRNIFRYKKEINKNGKEKNVLSLTLRGVINNDIENPIGLSPKDYATYQLFEKNDLVFKLIDLNNVRTSRVGVVHESGIMSSAYIRLCINNKIGYHKYFYYWFFKLYIEEVFNRLGNGVRETIGKDELLNMTLPIPPLPEQHHIANFLDWKISEIDNWIELEKAKQERLDELKEKIIEYCLFTSMNKNCSMKVIESSYMKEIPELWDLCKISQLFKIQKKIANQSGFDVLSITQSGIKVKDISKNEGQMASDYSKYQIVEVGDFAMNHMDLITGYIDISKYRGVTSPDYRVFTVNSDDIVPEYYLYMLQLFYKKRVFYKYGRGAANQGRWRLPAKEFLNLYVPLPPRFEQKEIVKKIEEKVKQIDSLRTKIKIQISYLEELKQTLISDAVTGKIDVRNIKIPDYTHGKEEA